MRNKTPSTKLPQAERLLQARFNIQKRQLKPPNTKKELIENTPISSFTCARPCGGRRSGLDRFPVRSFPLLF